MLRKTMLITALSISSVSLTGCSTTMSTAWSSLGDLVNGVSDVTKSVFLRGSSKKSEISFAENTVPDADGVYKTNIGEYVSDNVNYETSDKITVESANIESDNVEIEIYDGYIDGAASSFVDSSPHPCPEGTYYAEDKTCMSLETDTYEFPDDVSMTEQFVDTSPVPCPEDTYLNAKNECMYLETESFDFDDEVNTVEQVIDTSPIPCPEGTYLNAENNCMYLETEEFDFAQETPSLVPASNFTPDFALNVPKPSGSLECPAGFKPNSSNSCMFVGEGLQSGNQASQTNLKPHWEGNSRAAFLCPKL